MKFFKIIIAAAFLALLAPLLAQADGLPIPPPNYEVRETDQKAVIFYEKGVEDLILSIRFTGNAKSFAWIIPTPSLPEVNKSFDQLFTGLDDLTRVDVQIAPMMSDNLVRSVGTAANQGVTVVETKKIDYYDITVLEARDGDALMKWLRERGYKIPFDDISYIFDSYIENGWYFTVVNLDSSKIFSSASAQLAAGHAIPLKLTFSTDKMVFPLKISSVNIKYQANPSSTSVFNESIMINDAARIRQNYVNILLYVFSDHKQYLPGFSTLYAASVDKSKIEKLATNDKGEPWKKVEQKKYFLTKLSRGMSQAEMTQDLYPQRADDDQPVNSAEQIQRSWMVFGLIAGIGLVLTIIFIIILIVIIIK